MLRPDMVLDISGFFKATEKKYPIVFTTNHKNKTDI